jgi:integrase/recombinase XerD
VRHIIDDQVVLSRPLEGPLAAQIAAFARCAREEGYARQSRYRRVLLAAGFSRWLGQQAVRLPRVSSEHSKRYLRSRARRVRVHNGDAAALRQFLGFLRQHDVIPAERVAPRRLTPVEQEARAFEHYLRDERALARATCVNYVPFIRGFLMERFGRGPVALSRLCSEAGETPDERVAFLPAVRALSRRGDARFGCGSSRRGQLVDAINPSRD